MIPFNEAFEKAELEYTSDISWRYKYETQNFVLEFSQDESGNNTLEQYAQRKGKYWIDLFATDEQMKMMFEKLNNTPYKNSEERGDLYDYYGVSQKDFY